MTTRHKNGVSKTKYTAEFRKLLEKVNQESLNQLYKKGYVVSPVKTKQPTKDSSIIEYMIETLGFKVVISKLRSLETQLAKENNFELFKLVSAEVKKLEKRAKIEATKEMNKKILLDNPTYFEPRRLWQIM